MNITIRLTNVEIEMLKELKLKDKRYRCGLARKIQGELIKDYFRLDT